MQSVSPSLSNLLQERIPKQVLVGQPLEFHCSICHLSFLLDPILMSLKEGYKKESKVVFKAPVREKKSVVVNGIDLLENVPPRTENEVRSKHCFLSPASTCGTIL